MGILDELLCQETSWPSGARSWTRLGLTFGVVGTVDEIAADPQALAAGILRPLGDTGMMTVDSPFTLSEASKVPIKEAPEHGQHSRAILLAAGYSEKDIADLRAAGTVVGG